jgi:PAS domain S-box-containing protein
MGPNDMRSLRVLFVADSGEDTATMTDELRRGGFELSDRRVGTAEEMRDALAGEAFDVVLCCHALASFSVAGALAVFKASGAAIPFLVVSGSVGEETAVEVLKAGAHDFLLKERLDRLATVLERELGEAIERRARRKAEEALRASEMKFRRIVETSSEGIWIVDGGGRTTYANGRMAAMLGATPEGLAGVPATEVLDDKKTLFADRMASPDGSASERIDCQIRRRDGSTFWASVALSTIDDDAGQHAGVLAMVADATDQRRFQEQLMVSDRMVSVGTLAAGVAHEINNPLAAILGNLHLALEALRSGALGPHEQLGDLEEELADSLEAAGRVRDIVRDLNIFSRTQEASASAVDVQKVVESSLRLAGNEVRHRARLARDYHPVPTVVANEARLGQVFLNLVVNAVQSLPEGHADANEIRLSIRPDEHGRVVVAVRDTGSGMPPEVLRRLFTPFFTTKPVGVGTGLGLAICHRIVSSLGGEIAVESALGKGTEVRVILPPANAAEVPGSDPSPASPPPGRKHLLVVDDEPAVGTFVRRAFAGRHDVSVVQSGREAFERIIAGASFDLILCDLMMPQMSGMDLYEEVRKVAPELADRFVFMTGGAFTPKARAFLDAATNARLEKPFEPSALKAVVNRQLRKGDRRPPPEGVS